MSSPAFAEAVSYDFTGTIHSATSEFSTGTYVIGSFGYYTAAGAIAGGTTGHSSFNGLTSFSYSVFPAGASTSSTPLLTGSFVQAGGGPVITITNNPLGSGPDIIHIAPPSGTTPGNPVLDLEDPSGSALTSASNLPTSLDLGAFSGATLTITPPGVIITDNIAPLDSTAGDSTSSIVFAITPVPEPSSLALFGGGLLGLALLRRRKAA